MHEQFQKFTAITCILIGFFLLLGKKSWFPDFYQPIFMGAFSILSAFFVYVPGLIYKTYLKDKQKELLRIQTIVTLAVILNGLGALGLYNLYPYGFQYDKVAHFSTSFLFATYTPLFFYIWYKMPFRKSLALVLLLMMSSGLTWELLEFVSDTLFKTGTMGFYGAYKWPDTIIDISLNNLGAVLGGLAAVFKYRFENYHLKSHPSKP